MMGRDLRRRAPQPAHAGINSVAAAVAIIDFLAESERSVGVQEVADTLAITKSRASRHLSNLEALGLVRRGATGRGFQLGWRVVRWGQIAASRMALTEIVDAPLRQLNEDTSRTVLLCTPAGSDAIVVRCLAARAAVRIDVQIGLVLSLPDSPSAKICFAFQPREQRQALLADLRLREPAFRVEDGSRLNDDVAAIHRSYLCWGINKYNLGHAAVAAPVFDEDEALAAIVTVMLPTDERDDSIGVAKLEAELIACAERCSRLLRSKTQFPRRRVEPLRLARA